MTNLIQPIPSLIPNYILLKLAQKTAEKLKNEKEQLDKIKWTEGEANTDTGFSNLACICSAEVWNDIKIHFEGYSHTEIKAGSPDISIKLIKEGKEVATGKIELKSGKGDSIPGSTIGKFDINQAVIYCKRNEVLHLYEFRYGQYHNCIGKSKYDLFQDRTPRPHVNFKKMTDVTTDVLYLETDKGDWVSHYAACAIERINTKDITYSWQDDLVLKIKEQSIKEYIKNTSIEEFIKRKNEVNL